MGTRRHPTPKARAIVLAFATVVCLGTMACTGPATPSAAAPSAARPATASAAAELIVGGDRPVTVHVPTSYDPSRPAPLLILLHGYTGSGQEIDDYFDLGPETDARGFVYAFPDGMDASEDNRFWNATDACCDFERSGVDDVAYLSGVIADIQEELAIDPKRIALAGWSNGGFMSYRMACERADVVSAIVSLAGATFADPADCAPSEPVSVLQIHGTADDFVRFDGDEAPVDQMAPYPGAETTAESWATYDGCDETPSELSAKVDVDVLLADGADPAETSVSEWSGCGSGATVQLWKIPNGSHFPDFTPSFGDLVMDFLVDHPKP